MRLILLAVVVLLVASGPADARERLWKRDARVEALRFVSPFVDLQDLERTIPTEMVPPRKCHRVNRVTVTCRWRADLNGEPLRGKVRVHRQRDGLLGFRLYGDV